MGTVRGWLFWRQRATWALLVRFCGIQTSVTVSCVAPQNWQVSRALGTIFSMWCFIMEAEVVLMTWMKKLYTVQD